MANVPVSELVGIATEYERAGRLQDAERLIGHVLAACPDQPDALHLGGIVAFRDKRYQESLERMEQSITYGVDTPLYLRNICEVYRVLGRLDDALRAGQRAVAVAPSDPLCLHNLAVIHHQRLELDASLARARGALALDPNHAGAHFSVAEALLLQGDMAVGWEEYEWRFRMAGVSAPMPPTDKPQWDGSPLDDGNLLLVADQGFGDVIQFMRYIPWVRSRCRGLVIAASGQVAPLIRQIAPEAHIFEKWETCPPFTAFCTFSGLPRLHGTRLTTIPWDGVYLQSDPARRAAWADRIGSLAPAGYRRIGIAWAGRPEHNNDRNRSASLAAMRALGNLPRVALVSLQKGPAANQAAAWFGRAPLINLGHDITDYGDTMAILDNLDLLVTVDTSVGHLAGAMGLPVWLMLPYVPDWRWLLDRDDTPWYPGHRLFRQGPDRDWSAVVARVAAALLQPDAI